MNQEETNKTNIVKSMLDKLKKVKPSASFKLNYKLLVGVLLVLLVGLAGYYYKGYFIATVVNGRPITKMELDRELEKQNGENVLKGLVNKALIDQELKRRNISVTEQEIQQYAAEVEKGIKEQGGTLEQALAQQKMTKEDFYSVITSNKKLEKLLGDKVAVSDEEVNKYLEQNKDVLKDTPIETLKLQIRAFLEQQKSTSESSKLFEELRSKSKIYTWIRFK